MSRNKVYLVSIVLILNWILDVSASDDYKWRDFAKDLYRLSGDLYTDARKVITRENDWSNFLKKWFGWIGMMAPIARPNKMEIS